MKTQMSIATRSLLLVSLFIWSSCNTNSDIEEKEFYTLTSLLINKFAQPVIPPPELGSFESTEESDSIKINIDNKINKKQKFVICIDTINKVKIDKNFEHEDSEISELIGKLRYLEHAKLVDISKIDLNENIKFCKENTKPYDFNKIDMVFYFSNIAFNSSYNKAVLIMGVSRGKLSGFESLKICKKINGKWVVVKSSLLSIS